ncbi:MAG: hypothetical protein ACK5MU_03830 [Candidatus Saccharimonadales bacterium]
MKRISTLVCIMVFVSCMLAGCGASPAPNDVVAIPIQEDFADTERAVGFVKVAESEGGYYTVFRERLTNYMYIGYDRNDAGEGDTLTGVAPLYDPEDGKPLTWERYLVLISN